MATDSELKAQKLEMARKANADRNSARLKMLESIADGSDEARQDQMTDQEGNKLVLEPVNSDQLDESTKAAVAPEEVVETQPEETATTTTDEPTTTTVEAEPVETTDEVDTPAKTVTSEEEVDGEKVVNGVRYYLTIVNGKERWLTKSQLIEKAQKVESADEYLKNASEAVINTTRSDPSAMDDTDKVEEDDLEKTLSSAVLGDPEAVKKIASTFSSLQKQLKEAKKAQPSVTPDVVKEIDTRLAFRNAVDWFEGEYSKELSDPFLKKLIYDKDSDLAKANPAMPFKERLKKAGDEVRTWINGQKGVQAKPSNEKIERKKTIVNVPTASQRQPTVKDEEEEEDVTETIQKMAQARHQPRAIVHRGPLNK